MNKENIIDYVVHTPHNPNKKVLNDMLETLIEENGGTDNPTYSWNDLTDKPFEETERKTIICESYGKINPGPFLIDKWNPADLSLIEEGESYIVEIDGVEYGPSVARFVEEMQAGNMVLTLKLFNPNIYSFEEFPVSISDYAGGLYIYFEDGGTHNVTLKHLEKTLKQLDEKFIPDTIARVEDISESFSGSWDDLQNKPFSEEEDCIWSGAYADMESLETRTIDGYECVKVSDFNIAEDLNQAEYVIYETNPDSGHVFKSTETLDLDDFNFESNYVKCSRDGIYVVSNSFEDNGVTVPFGLWIRKDVWRYVGEIYRSIIKQLDEKFIPDTIARAADIPTDYAKESHTHSWGDLEDTPFSEVIENITLLPEQEFHIAPYDSAWASFPCMLVAGETYTVTVDGTAYEIECIYNDEYGGQYELHVNDDFFIYQSTYNDTSINLSNGTESLMTVSVSIVGPRKTGEVLDEKYIPDTIARVEQVAALLAAFDITVEDIDEICGATSTETILDEAILGETTV